MFTTLWSLAEFDKNLLNVFILKEIHPECKNKTNLHKKSKYSKNLFLRTYDLLEKKKKSVSPLLKSDKKLLLKLEQTLSLDKALPTVLLYLLETPNQSNFSTYLIAENCKVSHNRVHQLMKMLESLGMIKINSSARSFFQLELSEELKKLSKTNFFEQKVSNETVEHEISENLESMIQVEEIKGLIETFESKEEVLDRNSLHTYLTNILIKLIKYLNKYLTIPTVFNVFSDQNEPKVSIETEKKESNWAASIINTAKNMNPFKAKFIDNRVIIQHEADMKENVLYVCNSWNAFASEKGVNVKKYRIPKSYVKNGIFPETDNLLNGINTWIQDNPEDWKEMWDEMLEYARTNKFLKGNYKENSWKPSLSWIFQVHEKRGLNLTHILNVGYDHAQEKPELGVFAELKAKQVGDETVVEYSKDIYAMVAKIEAKEKAIELEKQRQKEEARLYKLSLVTQ